jgi:hypothetical protein
MRYPFIFILSLLAILIQVFPARAQSDDPLEPEPILLTDEQEEYPLGLRLEIIEDPSGELAIDAVFSAEFHQYA